MLDNIEFTKMHGLGNDFVILDYCFLNKELSRKDVIAICNRHTGIGCDQLVVIKKDNVSNNEIRYFVRFFNPDGSESASCGNASRCVSWLLSNKYDIKTVTLITNYTELNCVISGDKKSTVNMGRISGQCRKIEIEDIEKSFNKDIQKNTKLSLEILKKKVIDNFLSSLKNKSNNLDEILKIFSLDIGNPHLVCIVKDDGYLIENPCFDFKSFGSVLEVTEMFPNDTNVELVYVKSRDIIFVRVWERGAGITMACGSGACAVAYAAFKQNLVNRNVKVVFLLEEEGFFLRNTLEIEISSDESILMTGEVAEVAKGVIKQDIFDRGINIMRNK